MKWSKPYQILISATVNEAVAKDIEMAKAVEQALLKFHRFDYGLIPAEDAAANNRDLEERAGHVLGRYPSPNGDIYINLLFDDPDIGDYAYIMYTWEY